MLWSRKVYTDAFWQSGSHFHCCVISRSGTQIVKSLHRLLPTAPEGVHGLQPLISEGVHRLIQYQKVCTDSYSTGRCTRTVIAKEEVHRLLPLVQEGVHGLLPLAPEARFFPPWQWQELLSQHFVSFGLFMISLDFLDQILTNTKMSLMHFLGGYFAARWLLFASAAFGRKFRLKPSSCPCKPSGSRILNKYPKTVA